MDNVEKQEISYTEYLNNKKQTYYTYKEVKNAFMELQNMCLNVYTFENLQKFLEMYRNKFTNKLLVNNKSYDDYEIERILDISPDDIICIEFGDYKCFKNIKMSVCTYMDAETGTQKYNVILYVDLVKKYRSLISESMYVGRQLQEKDITEENIENLIKKNKEKNKYIFGDADLDWIKSYYKPYTINYTTSSVTSTDYRDYYYNGRPVRLTI